MENHGVSWSSVPSSRLSIGIGYLTGSSTDVINQVVGMKFQLSKKVSKELDGLTFDYKDEAAAKKLSRMRKQLAYLTVDEKMVS